MGDGKAHSSFGVGAIVGANIGGANSIVNSQPRSEAPPCPICGGELLWRGKPFRPGVRVWLRRIEDMLAESQHDHEPGCFVTVVPTLELIGMGPEQAAAEAARRNNAGPTTPNGPAAAPPPSP